ncbi:MAG: HEPN domain-containing protein [Candidatus Eremiobacterota bacterium]
MSKDQIELLNEARKSLSAAKLLLDGGYTGYAASRAYYAMFYIAEAFLEGEGMSFSKHSAVIANFGKYFSHTGKVPVEFHKYLIEAQALRHTGDYDYCHTVSLEQAQEQIIRSEKFIEMAENLIKHIL